MMEKIMIAVLVAVEDLPPSSYETPPSKSLALDCSKGNRTRALRHLSQPQFSVEHAANHSFFYSLAAKLHLARRGRCTRAKSHSCARKFYTHGALILSRSLFSRRV